MKKSLLIFFCLFLTSFVKSQDKKFEFDFDYSQFAYDSTANYVEFYYSFGQNSLIKQFKDSSFIIEGLLSIEIIDSSSQNQIVNREWRISHEMKDTLNIENSLVGVVGFVLPSGVYRCTVSGKDSSNSINGKTYNEYLNIKPFIDSNITLSNIQLASKITQDSPNINSIFYKNTYEVIPMPASVYGEAQPVLFHYFEIYNLETINHENLLILNTLVYNSRGKLVFNKSKQIKTKVSSRVEVGTVVLNKLPTDTYVLIITLIDSTGNYGVSSAKKFFMLNPSVVVVDSLEGEISDVFASQFGVMSEEELDDLFEQSEYIATSQEIEQYNSLNSIEGKQKFLNQFWNIRDTDPSTSRNEYLIEYLDRIQKSNQQFSALGKKGWKSDRGRVYLKYGEPSEIERFPNQIDSKPYEIWRYNEIEGGVFFIFADMTNFSDYQLVHSTARGELRDDNWERRIRNI